MKSGGCGAGVALILAFTTACAPDLPTLRVPEGIAVTDAGLTMSVVSAELVRPLSKEFSWGLWFLVDLRVSSDNRTRYFNPVIQQLFIDDYVFTPNVPAAESASSDTDSAAALLPKSEATVALAFDVSKSNYSTRSTIQLVIRGDVSSPGAVVTLPGKALRWPS